MAINALNTPTILNAPKYFEIVPNRDLSHIMSMLPTHFGMVMAYLLPNLN
jgi:hypothetical protein